MEIMYTAYAEEQLQERKIERAWIEDAVKFPDMIIHQEHKYYVVKKLNGKTVKVLCQGKVYKDHHLLLSKMNIRYDPEADALYIKFREDEVDHTQEIDQNTIVDFNDNNEVIGMEVLFVRERNPDLLREFKVENLISA